MKNVFKVHTLMKTIFVRYWRVNCALASKDCSVCEMRDYILLLTITYRIKLSDVGPLLYCAPFISFPKLPKLHVKKYTWGYCVIQLLAYFYLNSQANLILFLARNYKSFFSSHKTQPSSIEMLRSCWKRKHKWIVGSSHCTKIYVHLCRIINPLKVIKICSTLN